MATGWRIESAYSLLGDWGLVSIWLGTVGPLQVTGDWDEWEPIGRELLQTGRTAGEVDLGEVKVALLPGGTRLPLTPGTEDQFYDALLIALATMEGDRASGARGYYERWARRAERDRLVGSYKILMTGY